MNPTPKAVLLIFLSFILSCEIFGQASQINWTTDSEFLPQNSIKSIVPDKYGFIWMTTENGLVRYDGKKFAIYDSHNTDIKSNRLIYIIGNYQADSLYTTNDWDEQYIFIHKRKIQLVDKKSHPKASQFDIGTVNGRFSANGTPSLLLDAPKRPYHIPLSSGNYYHIDNDSVRLYNPKGKNLFKIRFEYESNINFFTIGETLFYLEKSGRYAIITNGKIIWKQLGETPTENYTLYWNCVSGQAFLYAENKLHLLKFDSNQLTTNVIVENEALNLYRIKSVYYDEKGKIVYLGSATKGLGIYKTKSFKTISPPSNEMSEVFYALLPFEQNVIAASGVVMNKTNVVENFKFTSDTYLLAYDDYKNLWTTRGSRLLCYTKKSGYKENVSWDFKKEITSLYTDLSGKIWFSLAKIRKKDGVLYHFIPSEKPVFTPFVTLNFHPKFIRESPSKTLLLASNRGLYEVHLPTKKITQIPGTANLKVRNIFISSKKNIWISTYEDGFFLIKDKKTFSMPLDRNEHLLSSHCIVEDKKGFFWISTNKGLFQVKEKCLLDHAAKKISYVYYHHYVKDAGFLTNEFNGGCQPCSAFLNDHIYLPSIIGVVAFNPEAVDPILPDHAIYVDEALIDDQKVMVEDTLNLEHKFGRITFYITSPYYGNSNNLNFEVKLDGDHGTKWTKISGENNISFTNLSPGEYRFLVRKLSGFDSRFDYKKIIIIIKPTFWETTWFKITVIGLFVLMGMGFYTLRIKYIKKKNLLLEKKIQEQTQDFKDTIRTLRATKEHLNQQIDNNTKIIQYITHDIKSPLKFMALASKHMYDNFEEHESDLKTNIQSIFTSSSQMYNFVDNLLEYSKVYLDKDELFIGEIHLHEVINEKVALFHSIASAKKIAVKNLIKNDVTLKGNKQLFSIIIHNLLDNALKNTQQGTIVFYTLHDENATSIAISDTGNGMSQATLDYYNNLFQNYDSSKSKSNSKIGLHIVIELLMILNGKIFIESNLGIGTVITLTFKNN